jgi:hypothetical protein
MAAHQGDKIVLTAQQAHQGKELGIVRCVLTISLMQSVIVSVVIYASFFR